MTSRVPSTANPHVELRLLFQQHGYVRRPSKKRQAALGPKYKKGYEVRLVVSSKTALRQVQRWLKQAGLAYGAPYANGSRLVQPIYGKEAVDWFLADTPVKL